MRSLIILLFSSCILFFSSCMSQNLSNISVGGKISDKETGQPIANAEVVVLCWYYHSFDDASFISKAVKTDSKGNYKAKFKKGYEVDVASKSSGYYPNRKYNELKNNEIILDLSLGKNIETPDLKFVLNSESDLLDLNSNTPFLRVRFQKNQNEENIDIQTFGFDMNKMQTTLDLKNADFWFKIENSEKQPNTIFTNKMCGIIPIKYKDFESSLLYEKNAAPINGYVTEYELSKDDKGFFVRSRDGNTYGKVIFENSEIDSSTPDGKGGFYKDYGKNFTCLYQPNGTTNLAYQYVDFDLERFLVDGGLR